MDNNNSFLNDAQKSVLLNTPIQDIDNVIDLYVEACKKINGSINSGTSISWESPNA